MQLTFNAADDTALIEKCIRQDGRAWSELVDRHEGMVYNAALRFGMTPQDAEDVTQEVFVKLLANLNTVRTVKGWLFTVTKRTCGEQRNKHKSETELLDDLPAPNVEMRRLELREQIEKALAHLSKTEKQVMVLLMRNPDATDAEIAAGTHTQVSGVRMLKSRTREHFDKWYKF